MKNEIKGKVIQVPPAVTGLGTRGSWGRQTVVIEYENGRYSNKLALECGGNKYEEFGKIKVCQVVTFWYDVTSQEYGGKWYHRINCFEWKVEGASPQSDSVNKDKSDMPF